MTGAYQPVVEPPLSGSTLADDRRIDGRASWAIIVLAITLTFNFLDRQLLVLLITPIRHDLKISDTQISLLVGMIFVIFYLAVGLPMSTLVDRGPRKWILATGLGVWSVATAMCGLAHSFGQLALARMGVGVGESCCGPGIYSMTADLVPRDRLGSALSIINLGGVMGVGMSMLVGSVVITSLTRVGDITLPMVGLLHPWQMTFAVVGLPGLVWAVVLLATVPEPPRAHQTQGDVPSWGDTLAFLARWRSAYLPLISSMGATTMLSFGMSAWSPSLLERKFGWHPGQPGLYIGAVALLVSPVGVLLGGWLADRRFARGHDDSNGAIMLLSSIAVVPFAILFPLMPSASSALSALAGALFFGALGNGPTMAAFQSITPGRMRGKSTALYLMLFNLLGYGLGPLLVALVTEKIFADSHRLPEAMAIIAALIGPIAIGFTWLLLPAYRKAVGAARKRDSGANSLEAEDAVISATR